MIPVTILQLVNNFKPVNILEPGPCVCLQGLWQEVKDLQQHQQTREAFVWQASSLEEILQLLHVGQGLPLKRSSSI